MINVGEAGAVLRVGDEASAVLKLVADQFERLDAVIKKTTGSLAAFKLPPGVSAQLAKMNEQLALLPGSADKAAGGVDTAFGTIDASITTTMGRVGALKAEMLELGRIPGLPAAAAGGSGWAGARRGTAGGGHGGGG